RIRRAPGDVVDRPDRDPPGRFVRPREQVEQRPGPAATDPVAHAPSGLPEAPEPKGPGQERARRVQGGFLEGHRVDPADGMLGRDRPILPRRPRLPVPGLGARYELGRQTVWIGEGDARLIAADAGPAGWH